MLIAVIDDGIDPHRLSEPERLIEDLIVDDGAEEIRERVRNDAIIAFHGTTCARIIERYAAEARFISLCIFQDRSLKTNCRKLIMALEWCLKRKIPLIHMSVGTRRLSDYGKLRRTVARVLQQGQIIVAAKSNDGSYTMPACLGGVIGVKADRNLKDACFHFCESDKGIQLAASSLHNVRMIEGGMERTQIANSYAAPTVTAAVCHILAKYSDRTVYVPRLFQMLVNGNGYSAFRPDFIEDAVLLNLASAQLSEDNFFFSYTDITMDFFSDYSRKESADIRKRSLIVIPSKHRDENEKAFLAIQKNLNLFYGILYCGVIHSECRRKKEMPLFWSESDCGILKWMQKEWNKENECPIVHIASQNFKDAKLVCELQERFWDEGYECVTASSQAYSYLYGFEYIPPDTESVRLIQYLEEVYQPELIIIWSDKLQTPEFMDEEDIYRVVCKEKDISELYDSILAYFS